MLLVRAGQRPLQGGLSLTHLSETSISFLNDALLFRQGWQRKGHRSEARHPKVLYSYSSCDSSHFSGRYVLTKDEQREPG